MKIEVGEYIRTKSGVIIKADFIDFERLRISQKGLGCDFEDVKSDRWSSGYIATVYSEDLMVGVSDTEFCPESPITREQMAVIACKLIGAV